MLCSSALLRTLYSAPTIQSIYLTVNLVVCLSVCRPVCTEHDDAMPQVHATQRDDERNEIRQLECNDNDMASLAGSLYVNAASIRIMPDKVGSQHWDSDIRCVCSVQNRVRALADGLTGTARVVVVVVWIPFECNSKRGNSTDAHPQEVQRERERWSRFRYPMLVTLSEKDGVPCADARALTPLDYPEPLRSKLVLMQKGQEGLIAKLPPSEHTVKGMT